MHSETKDADGLHAEVFAQQLTARHVSEAGSASIIRMHYQTSDADAARRRSSPATSSSLCFFNGKQMCIQEEACSGLAQEIGYPDFCRGSTQSFHTNAGIIAQLGENRFILNPCPFAFTSHFSGWSPGVTWRL
jgi:hypothetical protein